MKKVSWLILLTMFVFGCDETTITSNDDGGTDDAETDGSTSEPFTYVKTITDLGPNPSTIPAVSVSFVDIGTSTFSATDEEQLDALSEVPRFAVNGTDFSSSYFAWVDEEGNTLDSDWYNSGTTDTGLTASLSGDTAVATKLPGDGSFYVLDRYGVDVITRFDLPSGYILGQVRTHGDDCDGFSSNPTDIVVLSETRALVSRYTPNTDSDATPVCQGNDLLEFNPSTMELTENTIDLSSLNTTIDIGTEESPNIINVYARPNRMFLTETNFIVVGLSMLSEFYSDYTSYAADGALAIVDPSDDSINSYALTGLQNCGQIYPVPNEPNQVAVVCTGYNFADPTEAAGVVILEIDEAGTAIEVASWNADSTSSDLQFISHLVMFDSTTALAVEWGTYGSTEDTDKVYLVDFSTGEATFIMASTNSYDFFGSIAYDPESKLVLFADKSSGVLVYQFNESDH